MKTKILLILLISLFHNVVFSQTTPVIIPSIAKNVFSNIALVKEINAGMGTESGELEVPVKKDCGIDAKGKCLLGVTLLMMDKLGFEQYKQYAPDWKKGIEEEYKSAPANISAKRCCLKFEELDGGTLATWSNTLTGIGEGEMSVCIQKEFRWHSTITYSIADLNIIMDGDNDEMAKSFFASMIAKVKKN